MYLLLFPSCSSENLQQKTFKSGISQSCTFQDLTRGRLMAFFRGPLGNFFSFPFYQSALILALGKVSDGAQRLHIYCKPRKRMVLAAGELAQLWGALHKRAENQTNSLCGRSFSLPSFQVLVTSLPLLHHPDLNSVSFVCSLCRLPFSGDGA